MAPAARGSNGSLEAQEDVCEVCCGRVSTVATDGSIEIDLSNRIVRVRGIVDAGVLREVLAATR